MSDFFSTPTSVTVAWCVVLLVCGVIAGYIGFLKGKRSMERYMETALDYTLAVSQFEQWCGHMNPAYRLIARHLAACGNGLELNAGTPAGEEPCVVSGLREQLKRLEPSPAATKLAVSVALQNLRLKIESLEDQRQNRRGDQAQSAEVVIPKDQVLRCIHAVAQELLLDSAEHDSLNPEQSK